MDLQSDFSGGPDSWFDLWHTHTDWKGEGDKDDHARSESLTKLFSLYGELKEALSKYPHDF